METIIGEGAKAAQEAAVIDATTETFMRDVIEASQERPIVVDFWATWCGPCKQLGPQLEKAVAATKGAVRLVKIDVDKNQQLAAQLRVQSIPTVFAFRDGQPVDAFQGSLPESQIKSWIDQLVAAHGAAEPEASALEEALAAAEQAMEMGDVGSASALFGQVLAREPANAVALAGLARCYLQLGDSARARAILSGAPENLADDAALKAAWTSLELAEEAGRHASRADALRAAVDADPGDLQARFDLALALYGGDDAAAAVTQLLEIVRRQRSWNEEAARQQLLKIFEALGPTHEVTKAGRRRLSSVLFS